MSAAQSAPRAFTMRDPEPFLRFLRAAGDRIELRGVDLTEMWSLAAIAALARKHRKHHVDVVSWEPNARQFAHAVGFDELVDGVQGPVKGEPGKTVRLNEVWSEEEVEPVSRAMAEMLAQEGPRGQSSRDAMQYMVAELLRNVLQHSGEQLGAVSGAQRNDRGIHAAVPVHQVVIADAGQGIRASLQARHQELDSDDVALERSLWPHFSRSFARGRTGNEVNAGLGLFYVSELVKELDGRLLIASGQASLVLDAALPHPQRQRFLSVGYPGTLVAFEIPIEAEKDFGALFEEIGRRADERTPRRLVQERLRFEVPPPDIKQFLVSQFLENNEAARNLAKQELIPRLAQKESVALDFLNVRLCTQSFAHALLFEALRISWATRTPIYISNAQPVVRSALKHVELYSQSG